MIVAGGRGARMGGNTPKQYEPIGGVPLVLRALRPFASHPEVGHVVLVLPPVDAATPPDWLRGLIGGMLTVVAGGPERSDSVAAGLAALPPTCEVVLVHDAARPFVERATIDAVIGAAREGVGAVAAVPLTDTLKETGDSGTVVRTIPRDRLWRAQTPQGFPRTMLEEAYARARQTGVRATDDAALVERLGRTVRVVPDSPRNFKVTTPDDLALARLIASQE